MIILARAFSWLNQFNISHLTPVVRGYIERWKDDSVSNTSFEGIKQRGLQAITDLDPLERPEALLAAAAAEYQRGLRDASRNSIREALKLYPENMANRHRRAVALWMSGILEYQALENMTAYSCWQAARLIFEELAAVHTALRKPQQARWYYDRLQEMYVEMAFTIEEAYTWLNVFPPEPGQKPGLRVSQASSRAGPSVTAPTLPGSMQSQRVTGASRPEQPVYIVIDKVNDRARQHRYASARKFMEQLRFLADRSQDHTEKPEIWLECGLAAHQMDMQEEAVDLLRHAGAMYGQRSHQQAVVFWMIGDVLWRIEDRRHEVIPYWNQAIGIFQDLETRADHRDRQERREWYHHLLEILPLALERRISHL